MKEEIIHEQRLELLKRCGLLIESGNIGGARSILLDLLPSCTTDSELEKIMEYANTIKALEIIELSYQKKPNKTKRYAQEVEQAVKEANTNQEKELESLLGKFAD